MTSSKDYIPIILTGGLTIVSFFVFPLTIKMNLTILFPIILYIVIGTGYLLSLALGVFSQNNTVKLFSILANLLCLVPTCLVLYLLFFFKKFGP